MLTHRRATWLAVALVGMVAALILGGLGWATSEALRLEQDRLEARARHEHHSQLQLALWRMDSLLISVLASESGRPYGHYNAFFAPSKAWKADGTPLPAGQVIEASPLQSATDPDWVLLHFQVSDAGGWTSPEVLESPWPAPETRDIVGMPTGSEVRRQWLDRFESAFSPADLEKRRQAAIAFAEENRKWFFGAEARSQEVVPHTHSDNLAAQTAGQQPVHRSRQEFSRRSEQQEWALKGQQLQCDPMNVALGNLLSSNVNLPVPPGEEGECITVTMSPMVPIWLNLGSEDEPYLAFVRSASLEYTGFRVLQGLVVDWPALRKTLIKEIADLFPGARLTHMAPNAAPRPEVMMSTIPATLEVKPAAAAAVVWLGSPLRVGLLYAWLATFAAVAAVACGVYALLVISERRMRFVASVTHELRTPLTTFQLYTDLMAGGLIKDDQRKQEYLQTLRGESNRLVRLVNNVLEYSRLGRQSARVVCEPVSVEEMVRQAVQAIDVRAKDEGRDIVFEMGCREGCCVRADRQLVDQILGNLLDNALKYSKDAADPRIRLRTRESGDRVIFEVEDAGSGVSRWDRRAVFKAFRQGSAGGSIAGGGVGLGLALCRAWAKLLGGKLELARRPGGGWSCFRLILPTATEPQGSTQTPSAERRPDSSDSTWLPSSPAASSTGPLHSGSPGG